MRNTRTYLAVPVVTFLAVLLLLHPPAVWPHAVQHPQALHGGEALAAGAYHLELVLAKSRVLLYLYDRQNHPVSTAGLQAEALIWTRRGALTLPLYPEKQNRMIAAGTFTAQEVRRVVVTLAAADAEPVTAWFSFTPRE